MSAPPETSARLELAAMEAVVEAVEHLTPSARSRVLIWAYAHRDPTVTVSGNGGGESGASIIRSWATGQTGPFTAKQAATATGTNSNTARVSLARMVTAGVLERVGRGLFVRATNTPTPDATRPHDEDGRS